MRVKDEVKLLEYNLKMKYLLLHLIKWYQRVDFFNNPVFKTLFLTDAVCKYTPTCSRYTYQAIEKYGSLKGSYLGLKRIISCHPWAKGGYDPVT